MGKPTKSARDQKIIAPTELHCIDSCCIRTVIRATTDDFLNTLLECGQYENGKVVRMHAGTFIFEE